MTIPTVLGLLGALILLTPVFSRVLGRHAGWPLGCGYLLATVIFLPTAQQAIGSHEPYPSGGSLEWTVEWMPSFDVALSFAADGVGAVFTVIALVIGACVLWYSTKYLDPGRHNSFYVLMATFTFSMVGLVLTNNVFVLFVCWEITSLASFMLIARSGRSAEEPALRTMVMTFVGGVLLLVAVSGMYALTGTAELRGILTSEAWTRNPAATTVISVLVALAAMTKSAQFPFHSWLPDAMAAITPVSAYLHAAAVVKAGIFLLFRFSPIFHDVPAWNVLLITAGLITAWVGGWCALSQQDLKKLMAYSTVSQLGLIVAALGVGTELAVAAAIVHVIAHAMFKSGLFMMVGVVDHIGHSRIFGRMPRIARIAPTSMVVTVIGSASMAGIPPLMGFVSKEGLFTALLSAGGSEEAPALTGWIAFIAAAGASVLTISYCIRIVYGAFFDGPQPDRTTIGHEDPIMVTFAGLPIIASVPLAFTLGILEPSVNAATAAASGDWDIHHHLALFHGVNAELLASIIITACGVCVIALRSRVWAFFARAELPVSGAQIIDGAVAGMEKLGRALVSLIATERAARHIGTNLLTYAALIYAAAIVAYTGPGLPAFTTGINKPIDVLLLAVISFATMVVCFSRSRLTAIVGLSAVGILATVQIMALGAPDVTLTQLLVETMSTIMFMLILQKLPRTFWRYPKRLQIRRGALAIVVGIAVGLAVWMTSGRRERSEIAMYYLNNAPDISGGENIVNTILVEFRALDTMGELTVLGMAGIAIVAVMSSIRDTFIDPPASEIPEAPKRPWLAVRPKGTIAFRAVTEAWPNVIAMQLMVKVVGPLLGTVSIMIFLRGHNEPGGGFIAALVGSAIVGLLYMSTSKDRAIGPPRLPLFLIGGGILTAVGTGLIGLVFAGSFLEPIHGHIGSEHVTTSMLFDVGVYIAVLGLILVSFNLLGTSDSAFSPAGDDVLQDGTMHRDVGDFERTRERTDEMLYGELPGPLDTTRGAKPSRKSSPEDEVPKERTRVTLSSRHISGGSEPRERGE